MKDSKPIKAYINYKTHKWRIEFEDPNTGRTYCTAIPPTNGDRIDFIDRNFKYHYNYKGIISHGFVIIIKNGHAEIDSLMGYPSLRLHQYISNREKWKKFFR